MLAWTVLGIVSLLVVLSAFLTPFLYLKFLRKVPPSRALVRCGGRHAAVNTETGAIEYSHCKVVTGGSVLVLPWHSAVELDLTTMPVELATPQTLCQNGVTVTIRANAEVHVPSDVKSIRRASECLGGKSRAAIEDEVKTLLQASVRKIVAGMMPDELLNDREKFQQDGQLIAGGLLRELGLGLKSFMILQISDEHGYYQNIEDAETARQQSEKQKVRDHAELEARQSEQNRIEGVKRAEEERQRLVMEQEALTQQQAIEWEKRVELKNIQRAQEIDSATKQKDEHIKQVENIAKLEREAKQKEHERKVAEAEYAKKQAIVRAEQELVKEEKERDRISVEWQLAIVREDERLMVEQQKLKLAESERNRARAKAEQQVRLAEVDADHGVATERRKIAEINVETRKAEGRGEAAKRIEIQQAENQLEKHRIVHIAEAEAEKMRQISEADRERIIKLAEAGKVQALAVAEGNQAKGLAEAKREEALGLAAAASTRATGLAEAEAQRKLIEAYEQLDPEAQRYFLLQKAPEILHSLLGEQGLSSVFAAVATGMQSMDIKVLDLGGRGGEGGATPISRYGGELVNLLVQSAATLQASGLGKLLGKFGIDPDLWSPATAATKPKRECGTDRAVDGDGECVAELERVEVEERGGLDSSPSH